MDANTVNSWSLLLVLLLLVAGLQHPANAMETGVNALDIYNCDVGLFRLPPTRVKPSHYHLYLRLNLERNFFQGSVVIDLNIGNLDSMSEMNSRSTSPAHQRFTNNPTTIILNAENLVMTGFKFEQEGRGGLYAENICHDSTHNILVVALNEPLTEGLAARLSFDFQGQVQDEAKGLFMSPIGLNKWALATNLEPAHARRVFPCFDEPEFKATFDLTIDHPKETTALSNTKIIEQFVTEDGLWRSIFDRTPTMSSHVLSFTVGELLPIDTTSHKGLDITIYAPNGWIVHTQEILKMAELAYDEVTDYFEGLEQPLQKIDIVAVTRGYDGMKNWGLVSMRDDFFSYGAPMANDWHSAVTGLMKEMVRFWLGNLVTMRWWDDLWLMEGLASYLATELATKRVPEIISDVHALLDTTVSAMDLDDDLSNAHPIKDPHLTTAHEIVASYDSLAAKKSEAILRMFANYMGEENFKSAIFSLIESRAYMLVEPSDLWDKIPDDVEDRAAFPEMARQWTCQPGYPIIHVAVSRGRLHIEQSSSFRGTQLWPVPISFEVYGYPNATSHELVRFVLFDSSAKRNLPDWFNFKGPYNWLQFNANYGGYYRVEYNFDLIQRLLKAVQFRQMLAADQLKLLSDFYAQEKKDRQMFYIKSMLELYVHEANDGVVLFFTRILNETHAVELGLLPGDLVSKVLKNYHKKNGGVWGSRDSNVLKQITRSEVVEYLVNKLQDPNVIREMRRNRRS